MSVVGQSPDSVGHSVHSLSRGLITKLEAAGLRMPMAPETKIHIPRYSSQLIAVVGVSTGDEGKGRVILDVANDIEHHSRDESLLGLIVKINGGANSGHTADGLKLNLLPSGVAHPTAKIAISAGVVADPTKLDWEVRALEQSHGRSVRSRLTIDRKTQLSDLTHRLLDLADEWHRAQTPGLEARGSTGRGITQAYRDEVEHNQIYYGAFQSGKAYFAEAMERRIDSAMKYLRDYLRLPDEEWHRLFDTLTAAETRANKDAIDAGVLTAEEVDFTRFKGSEPFTLDKALLIDTLWNTAQQYDDNIGNVSRLVRQSLSGNQYVLCEFGQAYWLHVRHGYSPNNTSSRTWTPEVFDALEIPVQRVHSLGVAKAYDTKVGTHEFLTRIEESHSLSAILCKLEFGTTTNRQRMVGWFDAVEKGHALAHGGLTSFAINKLDALTHQEDWQGQLRICVGYKDPEGRILRTMPDTDVDRRRLRPVYEYYDGWDEDISQVRRFDDLPQAAKEYVAGMYWNTIYCGSAELSLPERIPSIHFIGVGPDPSQIIEDVPSPEVLINLALARYQGEARERITSHL